MNSRRSIYCLRGYGALARTDYKEVPPRVDYALTSVGRSLADAIVPLCTWGTEKGELPGRLPQACFQCISSRSKLTPNLTPRRR
jgi:DNA-binding HxlR family transcriptional regulator